MSYQVLARKWRPHSFEEMVGQEPIVRMLINALDNNRLHHAYLFTGTRGVGKTTLARIFAKSLNCEIGITSKPCGTCKTCQAIDTGKFLDLFEIDAASKTKVEDTRELLDNVQYAPTQGRYKVYLIDEVHMLSNHSFNALLKTLEEPPAHVKFLLATTDPKRLPMTVLSRCLQFNLKRVPEEKIARQLELICAAEKIAFESEALHLLSKAANGSMRDALSLLDQAIAFCEQNITVKDTQSMLGTPEQQVIFGLLHALAKKDGPQLLHEIHQLAEGAPDFNQVLEELLSILHQINVTQIVGNESSEEINQFSKLFSAEDIQLYYQIALLGRRDLALTPNSEQGFEMTLLRMLAFQPVKMDQTAPTEKKAAPPSDTSLSTLAWVDILPKLELSGMALALASHCTLLKKLDNKIELALSLQHESLLNKKLIERIEQALTRFFNKPIQLNIKTASHELATPAKQQQQEHTEQQANAAKTIKDDTDVRKIMDLFNATLDVNSIKAVDSSIISDTN
ncbi:MAG: hypothetical protein ACD_60C00022G0013 [uncultured bacterium]|nr:MAG: hypothetical protein ACD_60C00022G0013 [uncultured bacterium]